MEMTAFEKRLVNREGKGRHNVEVVRDQLRRLDTGAIRDVLELGCGVGYVSAFLARELGFNVTGTDYDPEQVARARELHGEDAGLRFAVEDASRLGLPDASFDLVVSHHVFHHVTAWGRVVDEVARVLRPGGAFLWQDLALPRAGKRLLRRWARSYGVYTLEDVRERARRRGLEECSHERSRAFPFPQHHLVLRKA